MKSKKTTIILVILFIISLAITHFTQEQKSAPKDLNEALSVTFFNVGQGDSSFIEFPDGKCMLIDASVSSAGERICNLIGQRGYDRIDYIVATHPHSDHIGGMFYVTECFEIGTVYMPDAVSSSATYLDFLNSLKRLGVTVKKAKSGIEFSEGEVKVEFLGPVSEEYEDLNNYSAVVKVTYGKNSFLFTGDAEELVETELLQSGADLKADVLKVGHHGSDSSSCDAFLAAVDPKFAVISCGKGNDYGHPHKEVLERLKKTDAEIFRTDINGDITLVSDGTEVNKYYDLYN